MLPVAPLFGVSSVSSPPSIMEWWFNPPVLANKPKKPTTPSPSHAARDQKKKTTTTQQEGGKEVGAEEEEGGDSSSLQVSSSTSSSSSSSSSALSPSQPPRTSPSPTKRVPAPPLLLGWSTSDRRGLWGAVLSVVGQEGGGVLFRESEVGVVRQLAEGKAWLQWVDPDHVAIYSSIYDEHKDRLAKDSAKIEKDVPRTFRVFLEDSWLSRTVHDLNRRERYASLTRLLNLGSSITDGYCQGLNFIAGLLMLQLGGGEEREAFVVLAWILRQRHLDALYAGNGYGLVLYTNALEEMMRQHAPRTAQHFQELQFTAIMYSVEWFTTLYSISCTKLVALAVLDLFLAGVDDILLRVGVAMLQLSESSFLSLEFEELHLRFKKTIMALPAEQVIIRALSIPVPEGSDSLFEAEKGLDTAPPVDDEPRRRTAAPTMPTTTTTVNSGIDDSNKAEGEGGLVVKEEEVEEAAASGPPIINSSQPVEGGEDKKDHQHQAAITTDSSGSPQEEDAPAAPSTSSQPLAPPPPQQQQVEEQAPSSPPSSSSSSPPQEPRPASASAEGEGGERRGSSGKKKKRTGGGGSNNNSHR